MSVWVVILGAYRIKTRNPLKTLAKIRDKVDEYACWLTGERCTGYIYIDSRVIDELLTEGEANTYFVLEPPEFRGCKARGYFTLHRSDLE